MNFCTSCGKDFGGVVAFDAHRVGRHKYDYSPHHPDGRRCLSTDEMVKKRFRLNTRGAWSKSTFKGPLEAKQSAADALAEEDS